MMPADKCIQTLKHDCTAQPNHQQETLSLQFGLGHKSTIGKADSNRTFLRLRVIN